MITNAGCVMKVVDAEVVSELPRDQDFEQYMIEVDRDLRKQTTDAKELAKQREWYQQNGKKRRLHQTHYFVKIEGEAVIPCNDHTAEMMFGKYKGKPLSEVPDHYFQFLIKKHLDDIARYVTEVQRRKALERLTGERIIVGEMEW